MRRNVRLASVLSATLALGAACSFDESELRPGTDGGVSADGGTDGRADAADAGSDAEFPGDAGQDAGADRSPDGVEAGADATADRSPDGFDAGPDADGDAGADAPPDADGDAPGDVALEGEGDAPDAPVDGPGLDGGVDDAGADSDPDTTSDAGVDAATDLPEDTPVDAPVDLPAEQPEAGGDSGIDADPDLTPDAAADLAPDVGIDLSGDTSDGGDDAMDAASDSDEVAPPPPALLINECNSHSPDWIEIWNPLGVEVDVSGFIVGLGGPGGYGEFVIPDATVIPAGGFLIINEGTGTDTDDEKYGGLTSAWVDDAAGEAILMDTGGRGIDYVSFRDGAGAGPNKPDDLTWSGTIADTGNIIHRLTTTDTDSADDWDAKPGNGGSPKSLNPMQ